MLMQKVNFVALFVRSNPRTLSSRGLSADAEEGNKAKSIILWQYFCPECVHSTFQWKHFQGTNGLLPDPLS